LSACAEQLLLQAGEVHVDDALHRLGVGELDVVEEAAPQERVGQLLLVVGGDEHHRPVSGLDQLARLVDVELHAVEFAQQVVRKLDVGLVDLVDQQRHRLVGGEGLPQRAAHDVVVDVLDALVAELAVAQPAHCVVLVQALLRLGGALDVPLQQRHADRVGHFLGQHRLAGARFTLHEQRPLQRDGGVDREHQVLRGDVGVGAVEFHEALVEGPGQYKGHPIIARRGCVPVHHVLNNCCSMKNTLLLCIALAAASLSMAQEVKGDAGAGGKKIAMCIGCHGLPGYQSSFPQVYKVPKIAGQNAKYIVAALNGYKTGDRKHPSMRGIAGSLSDQDIADVAAYYEHLGKDDSVATVPAAAEAPPAALKDKLAACEACHGKNFNNTTDPANPRLAGQYADYLLVSLKAYMTDNNPRVGRASATMRGMIAPEVDGKKKPLFSGAELKEVAEYLSGLPGELKTVPQSRFHSPQH
jgi:cytochrome c553